MIERKEVLGAEALEDVELSVTDCLERPWRGSHAASLSGPSPARPASHQADYPIGLLSLNKVMNNPSRSVHYLNDLNDQILAPAYSISCFFPSA